jgi:hypothetical protein
MSRLATRYHRRVSSYDRLPSGLKPINAARLRLRWVERQMRGYLAWEADRRLPTAQRKGAHQPFVKLETLQELRVMLLRVIGELEARER